MKQIMMLSLFLLLPGIILVPSNAAADAVTNHQLWAAISVPEPIVISGRLKQFHVTFALANDGTKAIDPKVDSWRLVVNGKEHPDSQFTFGNGPRDRRWKSLPPGDHLFFTYAIQDWFKTPGTYTIVWRGEGFETAPVVFRVLKQEQ